MLRETNRRVAGVSASQERGRCLPAWRKNANRPRRWPARAAFRPRGRRGSACSWASWGARGAGGRADLAPADKPFVRPAQSRRRRPRRKLGDGGARRAEGGRGPSAAGGQTFTGVRLGGSVCQDKPCRSQQDFDRRSERSRGHGGGALRSSMRGGIPPGVQEEARIRARLGESGGWKGGIRVRWRRR